MFMSPLATSAGGGGAQHKSVPQHPVSKQVACVRGKTALTLFQNRGGGVPVPTQRGASLKIRRCTPKGQDVMYVS